MNAGKTIKTNFKSSTSFACALTVLALALSAQTSPAASAAFDTAANYSGGGWGLTPPNNGTGFGAWSITVDDPAYAGTYLDTSSAVASGGYSWGTYAFGDYGSSLLPTIFLTRPFTAGPSGSANLYNQTFSMDMSSDAVGIGTFAVYFGSLFSLSYNAYNAPDNMFLVDSSNDVIPTTGPISVYTSINFSELNAGINISVAVSGPLVGIDTFTLTVSPVSGGSPLYTYSNNYDASTQDSSYVIVEDSNTTGNGYFNNLNITPELVPEPPALGLLAVGMFGLTLLRRRQR